MSQSIFHVRPLDAGKGWAIDEYDGRGAWQSTYRNNAKGEPLDKQEAQRRVFQLRRKAVNSAPTTEPVNNALCGDRCLEHPEWICSRANGHPGRHESSAGGDWHDDCSVEPRSRHDVACADVADASDPRLLISVAHRHWSYIGWPEDKQPLALLARAMELLDPDAQIEAAKHQDDETKKRLNGGRL